MSKYIAVKVDHENNAEWWGVLREQYPSFARSLKRYGGAVIKASLWGELAALPGFDDGSEYAETALIDCGDKGDLYLDVVGGTHQVFDDLSEPVTS